MKLPFVLRSTYEIRVRDAVNDRNTAHKHAAELGNENSTLRMQLTESRAFFADEHAHNARLREQNMTLNARCLAVEGALERQNGRYDALMAQYHSLKLLGATEVLPPVQRPVSTSDALDKALASIMNGLPAELRRAAQRQLAEDRHAIELGILSEGEVLRKMRRGVSLDGVPAAETLEDVAS